MATNTFVALDKITVANNTTTYVDFTSIPQTYTDLVLVVNMTNYSASGNYIYAQFGNGSIDTGANYSSVIIGGNGSTTASVRWSNRTNFNIDYYATPTNTEISTRTLQILNYSNTNTYKPLLNRSVRAGNGTDAASGTWRSNSAINAIRITTDANYFASGSTFSLYGIKAEGVSPAAKATGGAIYSDDTYYYHVFGSTGTFTPLQSLTCDYVIVAGGGGGAGASGAIGGGGGAGGFRSFTSQTLSATGYTVTVGGGGAGGAAGNNNGVSGSTSTFNSASATGGGYGSIQSGTAAAGGSGGGGGWAGGTGGAGNAGSYSPVEGYAGGTSGTGTGYDSSSGGGGAGGVGTAAPAAHVGGSGGIGATSSLINTIGAATGVAQLYNGNYYLAGGGGGAAGYNAGYATAGSGGAGGGGTGGTVLDAAANGTLPTNGIFGTGGGGGGAAAGSTARAGANGGSGIVIIRYAK